MLVWLRHSFIEQRFVFLQTLQNLADQLQYLATLLGLLILLRKFEALLTISFRNHKLVIQVQPLFEAQVRRGRI